VRFNERAQLFVSGAVELGVEFGCGCGRRVRQDGRGNPYAGRDDFGLLEAVEGRAVGRAIEASARGVERVAVVEPADGDGRGRGGRGQHGMTGRVSGIADGADDDESFLHGSLDELRERVVKIRLIFVAARRDVDDADAVFLPVLHDPLEPAHDVALGDAATLAHLNGDDACVRRDAAKEAARESAVSGGHDRGHHAVPARRLD
jgi:hypothetical protein